MVLSVAVWFSVITDCHRGTEAQRTTLQPRELQLQLLHRRGAEARRTTLQPRELLTALPLLFSVCFLLWWRRSGAGGRYSSLRAIFGHGRPPECARKVALRSEHLSPVPERLRLALSYRFCTDLFCAFVPLCRLWQHDPKRSDAGEIVV